MNNGGVKTGNWTEEEKEKLKEMVEYGLSNERIARRLNRTENAIRSRKYLMNLTNKGE